MRAGNQKTGTFAWWLPFALAAAVILIDRVTKIYIRGHFNGFDSASVIPGLFRIIHTENPGAAFGMLADGSPLVRGIVLVGVSALVLVFVVTALVKGSSHIGGSLSRVALGFILGGALGNLYDRIALGTVTDFLEIYSGSWSFPAFNVADSAITIGATLLVVDLLRSERKQMTHKHAQPPTEY